MKLRKITDASRRRYDDACGTAHALDLIGERWALLVMRELMLGPKRFSDIRADLPGISANVLTQRLEGLEGAGLLIRKKLPPPANAQVYELTDWGYEAEPIIQSLGRWAARSPAHDPTLPISATSIMLSFRTMYNEERARALEAKIGFRFADDAFVATAGKGELDVKRGEPHGADAIFTGQPEALAAVVYGKLPLKEMAGALKVEGDLAAAMRFISIFELPPKVEQPS
jgi:DNA-binding HxlR family transcriptional regulator/putative sterol carrier protein